MKLILVFCTLLCASCSQQEELDGVWKTDSHNYTLFKKGIAFLKGTRSLGVGEELTLNEDSTFKLIHLNTAMAGTWYVKKDSLILNGDTSWLEAETSPYGVSKYPPIVPYRIGYKVQSNSLERYSAGNFCRNRKKDGSIDLIDNFELSILRKSK